MATQFTLGQMGSPKADTDAFALYSGAEVMGEDWTAGASLGQENESGEEKEYKDTNIVEVVDLEGEEGIEEEEEEEFDEELGGQGARYGKEIPFLFANNKAMRQNTAVAQRTREQLEGSTIAQVRYVHDTSCFQVIMLGCYCVIMLFFTIAVDLIILVTASARYCHCSSIALVDQVRRTTKQLPRCFSLLSGFECAV